MMPISREIIEFLKLRPEWQSETALSFALSDFRKLLAAEMWMN